MVDRSPWASRGRSSRTPPAMRPGRRLRRARILSDREVLRSHGRIREGPQDLSVGGNQGDGEILGQGDELAVVGRTSRAQRQLQDGDGRHAVLGPGEQAVRVTHGTRRLAGVQDAAPDEPDQRVPELGPPEQRRRPRRVASQHALGAPGVLAVDVQIDDEVGVRDDHDRPAIFSWVRRRSVSRCPRGVTRTALIRARSASGSTGRAWTAASRQAITSRLRLRRWRVACSFNRSTTAWGMFFTVSVAMAVSSWFRFASVLEARYRGDAGPSTGLGDGHGRARAMARGRRGTRSVPVYHRPVTDPARHPLVGAVRRFVEDEVKPVARELDHADRYPHGLVERMRELGLFGCLVPREHGGLGLSVSVYARLIEELCRGWMSLAGVINSHTMMALIVSTHGTDEQRCRFLPRFARGDLRGGLCLTEPHAGSDVQAIRTRARREGEHYVVDGTKMFITNGREGNAFALLAVTDPTAQPRHRGMSCFVAEKGHPGFRVVKSLSKLGYKGVDTVELYFEDYDVAAANLVGGVEGRGFSQVMSGLEAGRINIAARCVGVAQAALEDATGWATARGEAPPALADMATGVAASRLITYWAGGMKDRGERCDLEAGMAKLLASETAQDVAVAAMRVLGEAGTLTEHAVERHYRDTPLMIIDRKSTRLNS